MSEPWRKLAILDRRVDRARDLLQRTNDCDPAFEERVRNLVRLVDERERGVRALEVRRARPRSTL